MSGHSLGRGGVVVISSTLHVGKYARANPNQGNNVEVVSSISEQEIASFNII